MAFVRLEGLSGKMFVPEESSEPKKHPCPDCFECQQCTDARCRVCRCSRAAEGEDTEDET